MFLNTYPMSTYYSGLTLREYITGEKYDLSLDEFGSLSNGLFSSFADLQTVNCANIEAVGKKCFLSCSMLSKAYLPNCSIFEQECFRGCSLMDLKWDDSKVYSIGSYAFCQDYSFIRRLFQSVDSVLVTNHMSSSYGTSRWYSYSFNTTVPLYKTVTLSNCEFIGHGAFQIAPYSSLLPSGTLGYLYFTFDLPNCRVFEDPFDCSWYSYLSMSVSLPLCERLGSGALLRVRNIGYYSHNVNYTSQRAEYTWSESTVINVNLPECRIVDDCSNQGGCFPATNYANVVISAFLPKCEYLGSYAFRRVCLRSLPSMPLLTWSNMGVGVFSSTWGFSSIRWSWGSSIPAYTFYSCSNLSSIDIRGVTHLGAGAFYAASSYARDRIPTTLTNISSCQWIGGACFAWRSFSASLVFPNCTGLGVGAFASAYISYLDLPAVSVLNACALSGGAFSFISLPQLREFICDSSTSYAFSCQIDEMNIPLLEICPQFRGTLPSIVEFSQLRVLKRVGTLGRTQILSLPLVSTSLIINGCGSLESVYIPLCPQITVYGCANLKDLSIPTASYVWLSGLSNLSQLSAPQALSVGLSFMPALTSVTLPNALSVSFSSIPILGTLSLPMASFVSLYNMPELTELEVPNAYRVQVYYVSQLTRLVASRLSDGLVCQFAPSLSYVHTMDSGTVFVQNVPMLTSMCVPYARQVQVESAAILPSLSIPNASYVRILNSPLISYAYLPNATNSIYLSNLPNLREVAFPIGTSMSYVGLNNIGMSSQCIAGTYGSRLYVQSLSWSEFTIPEFNQVGINYMSNLTRVFLSHNKTTSFSVYDSAMKLDMYLTGSSVYTYTGALSSSIFSRIFVPSSLYEEYVSKMGSLSYLLSYEGEMP